jgi:hypothetical protein
MSGYYNFPVYHLDCSLNQYATEREHNGYSYVLGCVHMLGMLAGVGHTQTLNPKLNKLLFSLCCCINHGLFSFWKLLYSILYSVTDRQTDFWLGAYCKVGPIPIDNSLGNKVVTRLITI